MSRINYQDIDVFEFLSDLGMNNVKKDGREIFFSCPFSGHKHGDTNPSASMQIGTTKIHCFGCGFNGNALTFLAELENISLISSSRYIRQWLGTAFKEPEGTFLQEIEAVLTPSKPEMVYARNEPLDEEELKKREIDWRAVWSNQAEAPGLSYMFDRGFTWDTLEKWHIGWDDISQRITIPWFDEDESLIGFKGRALDQDVGEGNPRYKVLGGIEYGFDTFDMSLMFFGWQRLPLNEEPQLIIVEGELNTIAMDQAGIDFRLGISGKHISSYQSYILSKMNRELILYFDEISDSIKAARELIKYNKVSIVPIHDKDPADSTADEINDLLSRRESAIMMV